MMKKLILLGMLLGSTLAQGAELTLKDMRSWGKHWAGPKIDKPADLEGKVVLLMIWGG